MKDPEIIYDEDDHKYMIKTEDDGLVEAPSVTTIMKEVGFYGRFVSKWEPDPDEIRFPEPPSEQEKKRDAAAKRGTAVHLMTEDLDRGHPLPEMIDEEIFPYIKAYLKFQEENDLEIHEIENIVFNDEFWYAGRVDRIMTINGTPSIVDIKTGQELRTTGLQLAAYLYAYKKMEGEVKLERFALHLKNNGTYKLVAYKNNEDLNNFLAAVRVFHYKESL